MIIYKVINTINNKIYIGQTINTISSRKSSHKYNMKKHIKSPFYNALNKYGWNCFKWEIIFETDSLPILNDKEIYYIKKFNSIKNGYNLMIGGKNSSHSEETKNKISKKAKIRYKNKESHPMYGKHHSEETKQKLKESTLKQFKEKGVPFKGKKLKPEHIKKLIESRLNSYKKYGNPNCKKYKLISPDDRVYITSNLPEFSEKYNLNVRYLRAVARNEQKTHKNWKCALLS